MREKIRAALLWTRIGIFALVTLYALIVLFLNRNVVLDPGLRLVFVSYEKPNAILTIVVTAVASVVISGLLVSFYKALRQLRELNTQRRLLGAEQELAEIKSQTAAPIMPVATAEDFARPTTPRVSSEERDADPIPLEPEPPAGPSGLPPSNPVK